MLRRFPLLIATVAAVFLISSVLAASTRVYLPLVMNGAEVSGPAPTPTQTTISGSVDILSSSSYTSGIMGYIVGEVRNNTTSNVEFVKILASLYDAGGTFLGSGYGYSDLDILRPGQRSPFEVLLFDVPASFDDYTLQVEWRTTDDQPIGGVTILSQNTRPASIPEWQYIYGEVRNDSVGPVEFVKIVATLYGANGTVVGTGLAYTDLDEVANGETSSFEILITRWVNVARYELQVQARTTPPPVGHDGS